MPRREKYTKGWVVMGRPDGSEKLQPISRRYHSLETANVFADEARKAGIAEVIVRTVEGYDKRDGAIS